ncbi:MAG: hypothetical protein R3C28_21680 [Pirellulaceae bacterium]
MFDVNNDRLHDFEDLAFWIRELKQTWFGDANLDGEFNSADFTTVFQAGQYEDAIAGNSTWATGDWNGDGEFDTSDLVVAFQDGGYELGLRPVVNAVPEANGELLLLIGLCLVSRLRRR